MFKHMILHLLMMAVEYNIVNQKNQTDFSMYYKHFFSKNKSIKGQNLVN